MGIEFDFVAGALCIIGLIVWLVRLESKINQTMAQALKMQIQIDLHIERGDLLHRKVLEELSYIKESVAGIKGYLAMKDRSVL